MIEDKMPKGIKKTRCARHWCLNGCGKKVKFFGYMKRIGLFKCNKCEKFFIKEGKNLIKKRISKATENIVFERRRERLLLLKV